MSKFKTINVHLRISILTMLLTLIAVLICTFCFFNGHQSIPQGFLLGGSLAALLYFFQFLADLKDRGNEEMTFAIIVIILRFLFFAGLLVLVAYLQFKAKVYYLDTFAYVGGYLLSVVVHAVMLLVDKEKGKDDTRQ